MKHDQGPDSSSKPYRRHRSVWGSAGLVLGCPVAPKLMRRIACPIQASLGSSSGGGGLENQPNGSLIGGSQEFQPATKPCPPAKTRFDYPSLSFTRQIKSPINRTALMDGYTYNYTRCSHRQIFAFVFVDLFGLPGRSAAALRSGWTASRSTIVEVIP